ncbi:GntR family transcriptional regulator [Tabrizicola sp. TH137]|uniref:GntR family transcriptional regulator n=1 Tax=Tabrizicola sp. TH137 TaxID=2067452 RepID=UPI000C79C283|nr:GntR family transcriptional regulator [Tabrizicola sp. TH137]PLL13582.1 GntR family transcriptional regulator [Tabrizicola sp. TH137]
MGWEGVRDEVLRRIRGRVWAPGDVIPGEEALAVEFGVARATVNRALRDLAEAGLLERRRKAGTRVALLPVRKATLEISIIRQEVEARGEVYGHRVLERRMEAVPLSVALRMGVAAGARLLFLETLHLAGGRPFAHEVRWLNIAVLPGGVVPDFAAVSANEWLVQNVAYATGDIEFSAELATAAEAAALGIRAGDPVFVTERATWTAEAPITFVRLLHGPGYRLRTMV